VIPVPGPTANPNPIERDDLVSFEYWAEWPGGCVTETAEFTRAEWDAMTPAERMQAMDDAGATLLGNQGCSYGHNYEPDEVAAPAAQPDTRVAELRSIARDLDETRQEWRETDGRTLRSSALGHAVAVLRDRADEIESAALAALRGKQQ
jgi:hypothetical protein